LYDAISEDYDRFVNWQDRLAIELPFIINILHEVNARSILDAATGTGMHAIALAQHGFTAAGADLSQGMVTRARENARAAGVLVNFSSVGFGNLAKHFGLHTFDALLCLGNSLPHLLSAEDLSSALSDFAACLRPDGLLMIQNRNFDAVMAKRDRWMEPQSHIQGNREWIFQRFYDFDSDGLITFNMVMLTRTGKGKWSQSIARSRLRPQLKEDLVASLESTGFSKVITLGNMAGGPFDPSTSPNLVITARNSK
jgi:glycine/sarcosine N-methyltransferase